MSLPSSMELPASSVPITAFFGEATTQQKLQCYKLGAAGFRHPLTTEQYIQREQFVDTLPLTRGIGWRFWCLYNREQPMQILATCKTIVRDLVIRDVSGVRYEKGYCIASLVTDSAYRSHGLASFLLKKVAEWMDGPGQGAVSFLYSRLISYYEPRGWNLQPSFELRLKLDASKPLERTGLRPTKLLKASDVPSLCHRDTERLVRRLESQDHSPDTTTVAVLPTADLVGWLHGRSDFNASALHGRIPEFKGSIDEAADVWIYWHHDFRRDQLVIQRVSRPDNEERIVEALASLLSDARAEAVAWNLSAVSIWSPDTDVECAAGYMPADVPNKAIERVERTSGIAMVRHSGGDRSKNVFFDANESYAWS